MNPGQRSRPARLPVTGSQDARPTTITGMLDNDATPLTQHPSLGPSALAAGNQGMTGGHWDDYEAKGRPGAWYIVPSTD